MTEDATGILENKELKETEKTKLLLNNGNLGIAIQTKNRNFIQHESTKKVINHIWYGSNENDASDIVSVKPYTNYVSIDMRLIS